MNLPPGLPITAEDWEKTPTSVQAVIVMFWEDNQKLKEQVGKLQERVNKNSQNSSKPPSSDLPHKEKYPKPEPTGEKPGGRKGHHGHGRKLKEAGEVSKIVKSLPTVCKDCGALLEKISDQNGIRSANCRK
jgi:transposase